MAVNNRNIEAYGNDVVRDQKSRRVHQGSQGNLQQSAQVMVEGTRLSVSPACRQVNYSVSSSVTEALKLIRRRSPLSPIWKLQQASRMSKLGELGLPFFMLQKWQDNFRWTEEVEGTYEPQAAPAEATYTHSTNGRQELIVAHRRDYSWYNDGVEHPKEGHAFLV